MCEGHAEYGVPTAWVAQVRDGAEMLAQARRLVDATIGRRHA
jgi:hypothetical protein